LVEEGKLSIVKAVARSKEHFPFGVSGSEDLNPSPRGLPRSILIWI
jgi:hypothetical protein